MSRPDIDTYFMRMATLVATRSTCLRRTVGCVLVNARSHVIATGYNGVAAGLPHCNKLIDKSSSVNGTINILIGANNKYPNACEGATLPSGEGLDKCQAIHAEQNALLQCRDVYEIFSCYTTTLPCITCAKLFLNTGCQRIVYGETYPHQAEVEKLMEARGIALIQHLRPLAKGQISSN